MGIIPALAGFLLSSAALAQVTVTVNTPMSPPAWALLERELLRYNSLACERFAEKYLDKRGYLLHTIRWGTLDGPDDAIETFYNWTLLHALGGSDSVLQLYKKAQEGHWKQYGELRTKLTDLAANGAYYKEFITQSDWFHTGEGMRAFMFQGLSDPNDRLYRERMKRFAGLYMNEDPEAPNYDPVHKVIRSLWNGSKGPMLRKATVYDWVGDPVSGRFHMIHSPAGRSRMLDFMTWYPRMLAHCTEYLDSVGDSFLNLAATNLAVNAFALTGEAKYRDWVLEYVGAWKERTAATGGNIPSNVGLDGTPGGEYGGRWWKGTYGWNFTIFDGEIEQIAHRNYFTAGSWPGFSNALLLTGDQSYIDVLRRQMDNIYAQKKVVDGKTLLPQMYGDPRGYKYDGPPTWYHYTGNLHEDRLTETYLWSMDRRDLERVPKTGWIAFLEGLDPGYPVRALQADFAQVRRRMEMIRNDTTMPETRLADYLLDFNPAATNALANLTIGAYFSRGRIWTLHSRFRYFDPAARRAGLPPDVGALVEKLGAGSATLTLVNLNPVEARAVIVQAGGYGEHRFHSVTYGGKTVAVEGPLLSVRLEPGCGAQFNFKMSRYVNPPTLAHPWDRK
ncbi:MAG TPA: hypothetical protein PLA43_17745 [Bryobacteraceae bacterium]|nr:hypothetical protein [Bryobacteraceae bacterium]HOL72669.1 hypothetical protein [Bryobacteraceae bacterium]HOQ45991.1 hypothetical protein [Bryobacteraceae bacterium]HPQ13590.1 hypothetical protein [Bryobacteraceae bacterium]HPU73798.1 hypothetical protein [Bryobacteraceae bacterium]